jgi:hypothetical protein
MNMEARKARIYLYNGTVCEGKSSLILNSWISYVLLALGRIIYYLKIQRSMTYWNLILGVSSYTSRWYYRTRSSLRKSYDWEIINVFYLHYDLLSCCLPNIYLLDTKLNCWSINHNLFRWSFVCLFCTAKQICINRIRGVLWFEITEFAASSKVFQI